MNPTSQARVALAGVLATLLVAVTLQPLVRGLTWTVPAITVVAVVVGLGTALRQVTSVWPLIVLGQVLALALTLSALFVRDVALWGVLPGPAALQALGALVQDGLSTTRQAAAPVPSTTGVLLLLVGGVGIVALAVDTIAVSLRRPAVAGLPLLAVYCVPAAVLEDGLGWAYFVIAAVGFLLLVGADSEDRVRAWGRILGGRRVEGGTPPLGGPLSGARRVAAVSLAVAVVLPLMVPGLGGRLLGDGNGSGSGKRTGKISVVNPILTLRQNLGARSKEPVITYTTTVQQPDPLRIVSDDDFDGQRWAPSTGSLPRDQTVQNGLSSPPGLSSAVSTQQNRTVIKVGNLRETYLPLPYPTTKVDITGDWLYEPRSLNVVGDGVVTTDLSYTAYHLAVQPTAAQLQAALAPPSEIVSVYGKLPRTLPAAIASTARQVAGAGSAYDQAVNLQAYFRTNGGFTYNEQASGAGGDDSGDDAVLAFLRGKQGYCVQFASAMAVMARTLGIPSRVAVGFLPGTLLGDGSYQITLQDAHAWPELYFEGVGWVRFEPTPAARVPVVPLYSVAPQTTPAVPSASATASAQANLPLPSARPGPRTLGRDTAGAEPALGTRVWQAIPWRLLAVLALLVLLLALPAAVARLSSRRRWRRAGTPARLAETAWDDLRVRLGDLGVTWATSWTPRALLSRLAGDHALGGLERAALARVVADLESARYAAPGHRSGRPASDARDDVDLVVRAVAANLSAGARRRARLLPRSGVQALMGLGQRADVAADQVGRRMSALGSEVRKSVGSGRR